LVLLGSAQWLLCFIFFLLVSFSNFLFSVLFYNFCILAPN
jgi:hypothetical protein